MTFKDIFLVHSENEHLSIISAVAFFGKFMNEPLFPISNSSGLKIRIDSSLKKYRLGFDG